MPADLSSKPRPDISSSTRTDALDLAMMAHQEGEQKARATLLASLIEKVEGMEGDDCDDTGRFNDAVVPPRWIRRKDVLTLLRTEAENG